jgi:hypothetical protein
MVMVSMAKGDRGLVSPNGSSAFPAPNGGYLT